MRIYIVILFIIAPNWKPKSPSVWEWINKLLYIYKMNCYSAIKNNLPIETTWLFLKNYVKEDRCKTTYYMTPFI